MEPHIILKTLIDPAWRISLSTDCISIGCNVPKKTILPLNTPCNCYVIIYFIRNLLGIPGHGSLCFLRSPVNYAQLGYTATIYGATLPVLSINWFKKYRSSSYFDEYSCTCFRFSHGSIESREDGE